MLLCALSAATAAGDSCRVGTVGVPPSVADIAVTAYETRGFGQVFAAPETLVRAITIWRPALPDTDWLPRQVIITEVDSTGQPDVFRILLHGPVLVRLAGDGVHPVEYRFVFEPPLELPRRGRFFADFIVADCFGAIQLLASTADPYADGQAWFTFGNRYACGYPTHPTDEGASIDLAFKVEFCEGTTDSRSKSWGQIKLIYR